MYRREIVINNPSGLHARPAFELVEKCKRFKSEVKIMNGTIMIDPKDIFSLLEGELRENAFLVIKAIGEDEKQTVDEICRFIDSLEE
ncbi:HPr family phosphocarrier protein [Niallia sp.]|uniref:HPr family phosphocarrier protein n=1 Tax=Niallia sp. TaxID=2837523 RepID=UPI0028992876|nr:HPr family phosphocarrier protein [Niallia sp.]